MDKLPTEILVWVFSFCSVDDLARSELVDRFWHSSGLFTFPFLLDSIGLRTCLLCFSYVSICCSIFTSVEKLPVLAVQAAWLHQESLQTTGVVLRRSLCRVVKQFCCSSLKKLVVRDLGKNHEEIAAATSCFSSLSALEELIIDGESYLTSLHNPGSEQLNGSFASTISPLVSLRSLVLRDCHLSSEAMLALGSVLSRFTHLRRLDLSKNFHHGDHSASVSVVLQQLPHLTSLSLRECSLRETGLLSLSSVLKFLPSLTELDVTGDLHLQDPSPGMDGLSRELHHCPHLRTLSIGHNTIPPSSLHEFFSALLFLPSLRVLNLPDVRLERGFADFLAAFPLLAPALEGLDISRNHLLPDQWTSLAHLLPQCKCLRTFASNSMEITSALFSLLAPSLSQLSLLSSLQLASNPLGARDWRSRPSRSSAPLIARMLTSLSSLQEADLHDIWFDSSDLIIISQSFPHLPFLRSLNLSGLYLEDSVVEPFITAVMQLTDLHYLSLFSFVAHLSESSISRLRSAIISKLPQLRLILTFDDCRRVDITNHNE